MQTPKRDLRAVTIFVIVMILRATVPSLAQSVSVAAVPGGADNSSAASNVTQATDETQLVKVSLSTSRSEVTSDGGYGVFADLQNVDTVPITLSASETMLVVQPELAGNHPCTAAVDGFYPTERHAAKAENEIVIQPREHYVAFWDVTRPWLGTCGAEVNKTSSFIARIGTYLWEKLAFVPGNYAFVVVGKAHRTPNSKKDPIYHTFTDQVKLHVGLTQIDAMIAAMFGGLIGYMVTALRPRGDFSRLKPRSENMTGFVEQLVHSFRNAGAWFVVVRNMFSAALVSAVVTILLSRISDTQFPIKVTVADFWGALTVGFIAFFVGNSLIDKIVKFASGAGDNDPGNTPDRTPGSTPGTVPTPTPEKAETHGTSAPVETSQGPGAQTGDLNEPGATVLPRSSTATAKPEANRAASGDDLRLFEAVPIVQATAAVTEGTRTLVGK